jgi:hypothetical protein
MVESKFLRNEHLAPYPTAARSCRRTPRRHAPAAEPHGVKSLLPRDTAAGAWFRRQRGTARRQVPTAVPYDVRVFFYFFSF